MCHFDTSLRLGRGLDEGLERVLNLLSQIREDWLGTGAVADQDRVYRDFEKARRFARALKLGSVAEWYSYVKGELKGKPKLPDDIPSNPNNTYKGKGWSGNGDWLGTGAVAPQDRVYRDFEKARRFVRALKLGSVAEWRRYTKGELKSKPKLPDDIPADPSQAYKPQGWAGFGDWLGTGAVAPQDRVFRDFEKARRFARALKLGSGAEWRRYRKGELKSKPKLPDDIPLAPMHTYKGKGWSGMGDWLGTGAIGPHDRNWRDFDEARRFVRALKLGSVTEWYKYSRGELKGKPKRPNDIPSAPQHVYKSNGWAGYGDWLGKQR